MASGTRSWRSVLDFAPTTHTSVEEVSFHVVPTPANCVQHARQAIAIDEQRADFHPEIWRGASDDQTLEQRWFAGAHSNVVGAYGNDGMANCALHWFVDEAKTQGLEIDGGFLKRYRSFSRDTLGDP